VISTIHSTHKENPNYTYEDLFSFVEAYDPDIIGVEIRAEDMDSSRNYLANNYPFEMYESIERFTNKKVMGFDWLGKELEGRAVPTNYWKETSIIKKFERELSQDSLFLGKLKKADGVQEKKIDLFVTASLGKLNDGEYDSLNEAYYTELEKVFKDTKYQRLTDFYSERDNHIANNILHIIQDNPGKKMLFLMGADHRSNTLKRIADEYKGPLELNNF
jgi:hypothetical protein